MRIAVQCHPSLYYVMYPGTLLFPVQLNVFISLLWFLFIVKNLKSFLVMQQVTNTFSLLKCSIRMLKCPVECSIFEFNIQKSFPRSLQLKKYYVTFKNRNVQLRFEISMADTSRDQLMTNDKLPALRVWLKIFTRFIFKSVFRVVEEVCHEI